MTQHDERFRNLQEKVEQGLRDSYEVPNTVLRDVPAPMVTVRTITFQHAPYIRKCIEGVLMQKTSFPVEYIIGEDFSTDGTREIVMEYALKYPDRIRVMTADRNVGVRANARRTHFALRGKYCALCEGDDYWTDPLKLQKQVDFLEANPDYVMCHHDASIVDEKGKLLVPSKLPDHHKKDHSQLEMKQGRIFALTLSVLYRDHQALRAFVPESLEVKNGDTFLWMRLGAFGKAHYMAEIEPAVYRSHEGGIWSPLSLVEKERTRLNTYLWMTVYNARIGETEVVKSLVREIHSQTEEPYDFYGLRERKSYQWFARFMGWFGVKLPR